MIYNSQLKSLGIEREYTHTSDEYRELTADCCDHHPDIHEARIGCMIEGCRCLEGIVPGVPPVTMNLSESTKFLGVTRVALDLTVSKLRIKLIDNDHMSSRDFVRIKKHIAKEEKRWRSKKNRS